MKNIPFELREQLLHLNKSLHEAPSKNARKKIIKVIKKSFEKIKEQSDPFAIYSFISFILLPEIFENEELQNDLEYFFFDKAQNSIKTAEQFLFFLKNTSDSFKKAGLNPFTSAVLLGKLQEVIMFEMMEQTIGQGSENFYPVIVGLKDLCVPLIEEAMTSPFAQEDLGVDEEGNFIPGKQIHVMHLMKEVLEKMVLEATQFG